ncbi:MAG: inositol monophosphatase family protein, partial [Planctomycetaceae bacterium]
MNINELTDALSTHMPNVLRWCGGVARQLRRFDVSVSGKVSGSANTDALTLADLSVQEIIVAALRDCDPIFRRCRIEAEESTGDLGRFATDAEYTISIDPIDGTKAYRDRTGPGYACMLLVRSERTVHYSLIHLPELGEHGTWVQAVADRIVCGPDDPDRPAPDVLRSSLAPVRPASRPRSKRIYLIGFQQEDRARAEAVTAAGLEGVAPDDMPGNVFPLFATGEFGGSLIHTPNVYDFPASLQMARILGGDALWVHDRRPVDFRELWLDERADMLRLPGI